MGLRTWLNPLGLDPPPRPKQPPKEEKEEGEASRFDLLRWFRPRRYRKRGHHRA